jgi:hypothetical protein
MSFPAVAIKPPIANYCKGCADTFQQEICSWGFRGAGRNFDFCYGSGVKTKMGAKIKGIVVMALPLDGARGADHTFTKHYEGEIFGLD